ncbi:hypothetical protein D6745_01115 [Candidatus Woesearchaeota archaeon]|nr:MAG: hypothetical protein D6745_01115 [Candidatus Woesearchaeota archaeon]
MDAKIIKVIQQTPDVKTFRFKLEKPLDFTPGQFIIITLEIDGVLERRAYSIASSPTQKEYVEFTIRKIPHGKVSPIIFEMKEGDTFKVRGPFGHFHFDESIKKLCFVVGGTGITPIISMLRYVVDKKLDNNIIVLYGSRSPDEILYREELQRIHDNNANIHIAFTVDHWKEGWQWHTGFIDWNFILEQVPDFIERTYYMCGPQAMINHVTHDLEVHGVHHSKIRLDHWG